jgi:hypothetical protein
MAVSVCRLSCSRRCEFWCFYILECGRSLLIIVRSGLLGQDPCGFNHSSRNPHFLSVGNTLVISKARSSVNCNVNSVSELLGKKYISTHPSFTLVSLPLFYVWVVPSSGFSSSCNLQVSACKLCYQFWWFALNFLSHLIVIYFLKASYILCTHQFH